MNKPISRLLIASLLAFSTAITPVAAQSLQPLDRIAAVVNEDVVLQSEMDRAVQNVEQTLPRSPERGLILVKGAIPGNKGGLVVLRSAAKKGEVA